MSDWQPWTPREIADRLAGFTAPWCVVGGWALDLWHGKQTRPHEDLALAEARGTFATFEFWTASNGTLSSEPPTAEQHQNWVRDPVANVWRIDIFLEPGDASTWVYRRDESLRIPRAQSCGVTTDGIPYLRPELVLLFKAKATRPKDDLDFASALPRLDRPYFSALLARLHPGHPWLTATRE